MRHGRIALAAALCTTLACQDSVGPDRRFPSGAPPSVVTLSAGGDHTCAIVGDTGFCWGSNLNGEIGDGTTFDRGRPVVVDLPGPIVDIRAGFTHTCALDAAGVVFCWGAGTFGQIGDGTQAGSPDPTVVEGIPPFAGITTGGFHTCGWTEAGVAYCWGDNRYGQVGDGTFDGRFTPTLVDGGHEFVDVNAGLHSTCGVTVSEVVLCWGANEERQLGDGTDEDRSSAAPANGVPAARSVTVGQAHACALTTDGDAWCWGSNEEGRLGDGTMEPRSVPDEVVGNRLFTALVTGSRSSHTCGISSSKILYCWGRNLAGQLGLGETSSPLAEPTITGLAEFFTLVALGREHTCAADLDGYVYCWGGNESGQAGNGFFPSRVPTLLQW